MRRMGKRKINRATVHFKGFTIASAQMLNTHPLVYICREWLIGKLLTFRVLHTMVERKETEKGIKQQERCREESMNAWKYRLAVCGDAVSSFMVLFCQAAGRHTWSLGIRKWRRLYKMSDALFSRYTIALEDALIFKWCVCGDIDHLSFIPPHSSRDITKLSHVHWTLRKRVWCGWEEQWRQPK